MLQRKVKADNTIIPQTVISEAPKHLRFGEVLLKAGSFCQINIFHQHTPFVPGVLAIMFLCPGSFGR